MRLDDNTVDKGFTCNPENQITPPAFPSSLKKKKVSWKKGISNDNSGKSEIDGSLSSLAYKLRLMIKFLAKVRQYLKQQVYGAKEISQLLNSPQINTHIYTYTSVCLCMQINFKGDIMKQF